MAAKETINSHQTDVESIVNRWLVDYYVFLSTEFFKNEQYSDFCGIRDVLESVLVRPLESTDSMQTKIRVLQLLSRINEGERLDVSFESDESITPLESALMLLENMSQEYVPSSNIPQQDFENVCTSTKEMIVGIFIKNNRYDKAKEVLNKHFPKPMVGKKAIFMGLISQKSKTHDVIDQMDFRRFKEEIYAFCQRLCPFTVPFLHKAAKQLIDKRRTEEDNEAPEPDERDEPRPSSGPQINTVQLVTCKHIIIQKSRLEAVYKALAAGLDERTFAQLEEEVESEEQVKTKKELPHRISPTTRNSEQDGLFQRDSGSPMEGSPADQQPQTDAVPPTRAESLLKSPVTLRNKRPYTVARLVVEPDSQGSSQCTTSQELEAEVTTEEPAEILDICNKKDLQSPVTDSEVTISPQKRPRQATNTCSRTTWSKQLSSDSEEDEQHRLKTPQRKRRIKLASDSPSKEPGNTDEICITDSSLDSSPNQIPNRPVPRTSSTPQKDPVQDPGPSSSKWKQLFKNAKESKDTWNEEELLFRKNSGSLNESSMSNSSQRKKWTESETQRLKDGVRKFGEGAWSKIRSHYSFTGRTNVNLKDRWRTMKRLNMV
ncbi:telomeric repeat binding factor a isoform X2 [Thunnus albacares]|uniref:telomeric repeat binding factor a isoform X2 n=1 Tax=Thunnus albacares TaxID=8236 RepID=UPI001CF61C2F|nr:telomeric repeat binding factor a isoform X2 [Thunnus albacares]